jgi:hypothetical protein
VTSTTEIDELPVVWAGLLEQPFACGERVRRALRGQFGSKAGDQRFAVSSQIREDARLAHAELRAPAPGDFPDAGNLGPEQLAVYRAAARGYCTLFAEPALALDVALDPIELAQAGVQLRLPRDLVVRRADGVVELRRLSAAARNPTIRPGLLAVIALAADAWGFAAVRVVAADLLALEPVAEHVVTVDDAAIDAAQAWIADAAAALFAAATRPALPHDECGSCDHIWTCPAHADARR